MPVRIWLNRHDEERFAPHSNVKLEHYAGEGKDTLVTAEIDPGRLSHMKEDFVLGKVQFWKKKGNAHRVAWVRIDNHHAFSKGLALTPESWIDIKYHKKSRTLDEFTLLHRVELFPAPEPGNDFIRQVFLTYNYDVNVPKPREYEQHFLVYCDARHLFKERVAAQH